MSPERQAAAVTMLKVVCQDLKDDATSRDGAGFDGRTVGTALGYLGAQLDAVARVLIAMLEDGAKE